MNDRELTKLSFLADALVSAPGQFEELTHITLNAPLGPSEDLKQVVEVIRTKFRDRFPDGNATPAARRALRDIAAELLESESLTEKRAGRALSWALENQETWLRRNGRGAQS